MLHIITDMKNQTMACGERQADWLLGEGYVVQVAPGRYGSILRNVYELDELIRLNPDMRECDFCRETPTFNIVDVRSFPIEKGPMKTKRWLRPVYCCDECAGLLRQNMKPDLIERSIVTCIAYYKAHHDASNLVGMSDLEIRSVIRGQLREFVNKVFANRKGDPERVGA